MVHTLKENLEITQVGLSQTSDVIASSANLFQISPKGFYLKICRKNLSQSLKTHLNLDTLCHKEVGMYLPVMDIQLDGIVINTKHIGNGIFEIFVQFLDSIPSYWYDCLMDMLISYPHGEFSNLELLSSYKFDS